MTIALRYTVRTDVGLLREGNEDSAYAGPHLLAIADGMGGHAAGEVASAVAIATLRPLDADTSGMDMLQALADAIADANAELAHITLTDPSTEGMGTTLTALLWSGDEVALCHIGDSRAYLLRDGVFHRITHDHTLVQSLVDEGRLSPEAAASHPQRSLVMRALQSSVPAEPDLAMLKAKVGDRYLLCSDGLSDVVSDETVHKTLMQAPDLDAAVDQLIDLAIRSGGPDNITCVLADVIDTDVGSPSEVAIVVGALTGADQGAEAVRSDSPAARAHQLAAGLREPDQADLTAPPSGAEPADGPDDAGGAEGAVPAGSLELAADDDDDEDDEDDDEPVLVGARRRRWPVVTLTLIVLLAVVTAGGYYGWRLTQSEYYVGASDGRVVVYRGVHQALAGLRLSSMVQQTDIPIAAVPVAEAGQIRSTIPARTLRQAHQIVSRIRHDYQDFHCAAVQVKIRAWTANQPKPSPSHTAKKPPGGFGKTSARRMTTRRPASPRPTPKPTAKVSPKPSPRPSAIASPKPSPSPSPATSPYPPKPTLPRYCPATPGVTG